MLTTITNAAKELGISVVHIRRQIRRGSWPFYRLGPKALRIDANEIRSLSRIAETEKKEK